MGISFSKKAPPADDNRAKLTDVVHMPALLNKLGTSDLRRLACVSRDCCSAVDDSNLWRQKFADRIFVPHKALRPVDEVERSLRRTMKRSGYTAPPYYKSMTHGWAIYEGILNQTADRRKTRVGESETLLMWQVQEHLCRDLPEILEVAERLRDVIIRAVAQHKASGAQVGMLEHFIHQGLVGTFSFCSGVMLKQMAQILAADAVALGVGGPAALIAVKISMTLYCAYFAAKAGTYALVAASHYFDRLEEQHESNRLFQSRLAQLVFPQFMAEYRRRYPFTDGQRDRAAGQR